MPVYAVTGGNVVLDGSGGVGGDRDAAGGNPKAGADGVARGFEAARSGIDIGCRNVEEKGEDERKDIEGLIRGSCAG